MPIRRLMLATLLALGMAAPASAAWPERPITLVVPFAAGGSTDVLGRIVAQRMEQILGQPIVVENRAGAGGNVGAASVANAAPDGYTVLIGTVATHAINPALSPDLAYDPVTSFAPVALFASVPNVLVVNPSLPVTNLAELIALLKAEPGQHAYASSGIGTPLHLSGALLESMAGVSMIHVPYKGAGPAKTDLLGGQVKIMFDNLPASIGNIRDGSLRGIAVTTLERSPAAPDLPTMAESGLPGYETYSWNALFVPAGTPPEIVDRLAEAVTLAVRDPEIAKKLQDLSATPVGGTPDELARHVQAELAKWAPIVKQSGATAQ